MTEILRRIVFAAIFMVVALAISVPVSRAAEEPEPEEWIFSVLLPPQWSIADAIFSYQFKGAYYLPMIELGEAYEFFLEAETDRAFVSGFAGREENSFAIDGERGEYTVKGETSPLPPDALIPQSLVFEDDIYVRLDLLNEMWPVEMVLDLPNLRIVAEAEEELSFVRRKKREDKQAMIEAQKAAYDKSLRTYPYVDNPYRLITKPVLDIQSAYTYDNRNKELTGSNNISGTQHIGQFIANYSGNFSYDRGQIRRPSALRSVFTREATGDDDLLVPTLKRFSFGDVNLGQRDLIGNNAGGRGFVFSNDSSTKTREFDRITVEGTGPAGWELELYNNNELLEFGTIEPDGEYRFENVVLNFGNNRIRVIMYGPQGQIKEVVEEHQIANSLLTPGDFRYRGGLVDTDQPFILLDNKIDNVPNILTKNAEAAYGLTDWLSVFGSYSETPLRGEEEKYYTVGASFQTPLGLSEVEAYKQINGGKAFDLRFITRLMGVSLNMRGSVFSEFDSIEAGQKRFETQIQANTNLRLPLLPMSLRLNLEHQEMNDGTVNTSVDTSQSFTGGGVRFNHNTSSRFINEAHVASSGGLGLNWNRGNWQTRGGFTYEMHPEVDLSTANGEIRYKNKNGFQSAITTTHNFDNSTTSYGAQMGYDFGDILSTLDTQYLEERGWQFILRASTSLNPYTPSGSYKLASQNMGGVAPVSAHVFLDKDNDGVFGEGDEPIEGVRLKIDRGLSRTETDENGQIVTTLRDNEIANIAIDEASLIDPYYKPTVEGYSTVGRRGVMPSFEFPVVETGAVDGTVWREPSGNPVPGMRIQLVTQEGEIVMTTETAFDGYYAFEFVPPGDYIVRADPEYKVNVPAETVTVSSEELFAFGIDLYLLEPAAEESAAAETDGESGGIAQLPTTAPAVSGTSQPAPLSPPVDGSSVIAEEPSDEESTPIVESPDDQSSSLIIEGTSNGGAPSIVEDVRIGEHPDKVRLVMDLSAPTDYKIEEGENGLIILVDLPHVTWEADVSEELKYSMVMKGFETDPLLGGGTRLVLRAREAMAVKDHKILPAKDGKSPRLYIDLERK